MKKNFAQNKMVRIDMVNVISLFHSIWVLRQEGKAKMAPSKKRDSQLSVYRGHNLSVPRKIFRLVRGQELCGVCVYSYPPPRCYGRRLVLPSMSMKELNTKLSTINRVVIHPKYRSIGLGAKLIRETLPL